MTLISSSPRLVCRLPFAIHRPSRLRVCAVSALLLISFCALAQQQPVQQPDPFAARRTEAGTANGGHRAKLFVDLAHAEMEAADKAFTDGNVELGHKLATAAAGDADESSKAAVDSGKRLKDSEIDLRRLQMRTRDIGQSLNFEDRPPIEKIVQRIELMREAILDRMFGGKKKGKS